MAARTPRVPGAEQAPEAAQAASAQPEADATGVMRAADVDPSKIKRAVLTADGWVCPSALPAPVKE